MEKLLSKKDKKSVISFVLATLTVFAYGLNSAVAVIPEAIMGLKIYSFAPFRFITDIIYSAQEPTWFTVMLCLGMAYLYREKLFKGKNARNCAIITAVSAVIVFALLLCYSYSTTNSWDLVFGNKTTLAKTLIKISGFTPAVYIVVDFLVYMNPIVIRKDSYSMKPFKAVGIMTLILMACWIPYYILLYPGCIAADAFDQLAQALNNPLYCWTDDSVVLLNENVILNNHHPILYTGLLKLTTMVGEAVGSYEAAFEGLCIFQAFLMAYAFSYMIYVMKKHKVSSTFYKITFVFCAVNPLFPVYSMTVVKDSLFCSFYVLIAAQLYELVTLKKASPLRVVCFMLTALILMFTRNNTIYILILILGCIVLCYWKNKKKMIKLASYIIVPVLVFQIGFINIICPALDITQGSPRELLSVPFQQTARYIKEHREEITPDEEELIGKILSCEGDIDVLAQNYSGQHADNIKNRYNKYTTTDELVSYVKMWFKGLINHSLTYVEAYLNLHFGWLSFEGSQVVTYSTVGEIWGGDMIPEFRGYLGNESARALVNQSLKILYNNPLTSAFFEMATYTWLYLLLLYHIIRRKNRQAFIVCGLALFNFLICLVGPVAYMRYVVPMVCIVPFAIFIVFKKQKETKNNG